MPKRNKAFNSKSNQLRERDEDADEYYANALKPKGNGQFEVQIVNGDKVIAKLKGSMQKGRLDKVSPGNLVLIMKDGCTTGKEKYYIIHKYSENDRKILAKMGCFSSKVKPEDENVSGVIFEDEVEYHNEEQDIDDDFIDGI